MASPTRAPRELYEIGTVTIPILRVKKLRHKKLSYLAARDYPANKLETEFESRHLGCGLQRS